MQKPTAEVKQETIDAAREADAEHIDGKLVIASARRSGGIRWCMLEDGSEILRDRDGKPAEWN